jgi:hypothetical protein
LDFFPDGRVRSAALEALEELAKLLGDRIMTMLVPNEDVVWLERMRGGEKLFGRQDPKVPPNLTQISHSSRYD